MPSLRRGLAALLVPLRHAARAVRATRRTVEAVPDLVDAILVLPTISRQLEQVAFATATLPEMHAEVARLRGDMTALPAMDARLAQLVDLAVPLQGAATRFGRFADRLPSRAVRLPPA